MQKLRKIVVVCFVFLFFTNTTITMKRCLSLGRIKQGAQYNHLFSDKAIERLSLVFRQLQARKFKKMSIDDKCKKIGEIIYDKMDGTLKQKTMRKFVSYLDFSPKVAHDIDRLLSDPGRENAVLDVIIKQYMVRLVDEIGSFATYEKFIKALSDEIKNDAADVWLEASKGYSLSGQMCDDIGQLGNKFAVCVLARNILFLAGTLASEKAAEKDNGKEFLRKIKSSAFKKQKFNAKVTELASLYLQILSCENVRRVCLAVLLWDKAQGDFPQEGQLKACFKRSMKPFIEYTKKYNISLKKPKSKSTIRFLNFFFKQEYDPGICLSQGISSFYQELIG